MTDTIKATEVIGELRKAARLYEVFKKAEDILTVLAEAEQREKQIQKDIKVAEDRLVTLQVTFEKELEKANKKLDDAEEAVEKAQKLEAATKEVAEKILANSKVEAAAMIATAKEEVASIVSAVNTLEQDKRKAQEAVDQVKATLEALNKDLEEKKAQFLKAFG